MTKKLAVAEGLEILARWLEDNINCETDLIFDNPEEGTDSAMLLPCIEAALALIHAAEENQTLQIRAQGDANQYVLLKGKSWFAQVLMNGEMTVTQKEQHLKAMIAGVTNE